MFYRIFFPSTMCFHFLERKAKNIPTGSGKVSQALITRIFDIVYNYEKFNKNKEKVRKKAVVPAEKRANNRRLPKALLKEKKKSMDKKCHRKWTKSVMIKVLLRRLFESPEKKK